MNTEQPDHGAIRNRREETTYGKDVELTNIETGEAIYNGPLSSCTQTVEERYCSDCKSWFEVKGIMGALLGCPECNAPWNPKHREPNENGHGFHTPRGEWPNADPHIAGCMCRDCWSVN